MNMNCPKCGNINNPGTRFCVKCGTKIVNEEVLYDVTMNANADSSNVNQNIINQQIIESNQNVTSQNQPVNTQVSSAITVINYFSIILAVLLKPFTGFKEELKKFNEFKNSVLITLIVSAIGMLLNFVKTIVSVVRIKSLNWSTGGYETEWAWENLKEINYLELIFKNFFIYLGIIVGVAAIYYLVGLIFKKQSNFSRLLGISSLAMVPMFLSFLILSPLMGIIWDKLSLSVLIIGIVYTLILLYETMNNEIILDGNIKYYFNFICLAIIGVITGYICLEMFLGSATSDLDDLLNLFK